jgi:hypothetical protein
MNGRRYMPPAMRRKMKMEDAEDEEVSVVGSEEIDPMAEGSVGAAAPRLNAPAAMIADAKVGDTVTFTVAEIDPETGDGILEAATTETV